MKSCILAVLLLVFCPFLYAQSTSVSSTTTDTPDNQTWNYGTYSLSFVPNPSNPIGPYYWNGAPFNTSQIISGSMNGAGFFNVSVPSNTAITPSGSSWKFTICPAATAACYIQNFTVTGATQTINFTPPSVRIDLQNPPANVSVVSAYGDQELVNGSKGQQYYNLVSTFLRYCQTLPCGWSQISAGGTNFPVTTLGTSASIVMTTAANTNFSYYTLLGPSATVSVSGTPTNGNVLRLDTQEPSGGGVSVTFPGNFFFPAGWALNTTANAHNRMAWVYDNNGNWQPWQDFGTGGSGGGGSAPNYGQSFTNASSVTIPASSSFATSKNIVAVCYDNASPANQIIPGNVAVDATTLTVTIAFLTAQSGYCVLNLGSSASGGSPGTPNLSVQVNNSGAFAGTPCLTLSALSNGPIDLGCDAYFIGPTPFIDGRAYHIRTMNPLSTPFAQGLTGNCQSGLNQVTVSPNLGSGGKNTLQVNDGVDLVGCGSTHSMVQPPIATVIPVESQGGIGTEYNVTGPTGATTRYYKLALMNPSQGVSQASAEFSITTGAATLGAQSASVTSCTASGVVKTCTTAATHSITVGAKIRFFGTSDDRDFGGESIVTAVTSNTFSYQKGNSTAGGAATSCTGGTVRYWIGDQITLPNVTGDGNKFLIYESTTSGAETLVGISIPQVSNSDASWNKWTYWGGTISGNLWSAVTQTFIPQSPPSSARNNTLVTTITGITSNTLTLAANALANTTGSQVTFDNTPNLETANAVATGSGGQVSLPADPCSGLSGLCYYGFNSQSYTNGLTFGSPLWLNDTMTNYGTLSGNVPNDNSLNTALCVSFSPDCALTVAVAAAKPGLINNGTITDAGIQVRGNAGIGVMEIGTVIGAEGYTHQSHVIYAPQTPSIDYSNIYFYGFGQYAGNYFGHSMDRVGFLAAEASPGTTDAPSFIAKNIGNMIYRYVTGAGRGMFWQLNSGGTNISIDNGTDWQSLVTPMFTLYGDCSGSYGGHFDAYNMQTDTSSDPLLFNSGCHVNSSGIQVNLTGIGGVATGTVVSGWPITAGLRVEGVSGITDPLQVGQNYNVEFHASDGNKYLYEPVHIAGANGSLSVGQLPTPAVPGIAVQSSGCSSGNILPAGSYGFQVMWFDSTGNPATDSGGHSQFSPQSPLYSFNGSTQCAVITQPTPPVGAFYWGMVQVQNNNFNLAGWAYVGQPCPGIQMVPISTTTILTQTLTCQQPASTANTSGTQNVGPSTSSFVNLQANQITDYGLADGCVTTTSGLFGSTGIPCGSGGGTGVSSVSSNTPVGTLFSVGISTPTTTPAFNFGLLNAPANSYFGNCTNASAQPLYCTFQFSSLLGQISLAQTQLTTNGDILTVVGGALANLAQGANGTFLGVSGGTLGYYTPAGINVFTTQGQMIGAGPAAAPTAIGPQTGYGTVVQTPGVSTPGGSPTTPGYFPPGWVYSVQACSSTYNFAITDRSGWVEFNKATACSVTLPTAGSANYDQNYYLRACNIGAGQVTITSNPPGASSITVTDIGAASVNTVNSTTLNTAQCMDLDSDNTNYHAMKLTSSASSGVTCGGTCSSPVPAVFTSPTAVANAANVAGHTIGNNGASSAAPQWGQKIGAQDIANNCATGGGSANAQTATLSPAITSYTLGLQVCWIPVAHNTSNTVTVNFGGGVVNLHGLAVNGTGMNPDDLTGVPAWATYNGTDFTLDNPQRQSALHQVVYQCTINAGSVTGPASQPVGTVLSPSTCTVPANLLQAGDTIKGSGIAEVGTAASHAHDGPFSIGWYMDSTYMGGIGAPFYNGSAYVGLGADSATVTNSTAASLGGDERREFQFVYGAGANTCAGGANNDCAVGWDEGSFINASASGFHGSGDNNIAIDRTTSHTWQFQVVATADGGVATPTGSYYQFNAGWLIVTR